jgi:hypothetical protein
VRDHFCLRTESATNDVTDYGVKKAVENLPELHEKLLSICDNYLTVQQDILETFVDRGQLRKLTRPTVLPSGKRIPGLKLDNPRQLALMHALVRFAHIAAGSTARTLRHSLRVSFNISPTRLTTSASAATPIASSGDSNSVRTDAAILALTNSTQNHEEDSPAPDNCSARARFFRPSACGQQGQALPTLSTVPQMP